MSGTGFGKSRNRIGKWLLAAVAVVVVALVALLGLVVQAQGRADAQRRRADEQAARVRRQELELVRGGFNRLRSETRRRDRQIVQLMQRPVTKRVEQPTQDVTAQRPSGHRNHGRSASRVRHHSKSPKRPQVVCDINDPLCGIEEDK